MSSEAKQAEWLRSYQEELERHKDDARERVEQLVRLMAGRPVAVVAVFEGYGDSGEVHETYVSSLDASGSVTYMPLTTSVHESGPSHPLVGDDDPPSSEDTKWSEFLRGVTSLAPDCAYALLAAYRGGWEINEGSHGTFVFYNDGRVVCDFNERVIEDNPIPLELAADGRVLKNGESAS